MKITKLLPFALLAVAHGLLAQQLPGAGSQLLQIPAAPVPQPVTPRIEVKPGPAAPSPEARADTVKIVVNSLRVTGARAYTEAELLALTGFTPGSELSLTELRAMAARIADFYHRNGYFIAQAYLPAQDIKDGVVTIAVIDGRYGQITLRNQTNVSGDLANGLLRGLNSGDIVASGELESHLLLLSDLPGVNVRSTLVPGATAGTSDLIVDMDPGRKISGSVDADNAGNRYTGEYRVGLTVNLNEPTGHGDVASLRVLTSGAGLNYARASYELQVDKARLGVSLSGLHYKLGREFESLDAHGTAYVASVYGIYPLIRSRTSNLYTGLQYDERKFQDVVGATSTTTDKRAHVLLASLYGDHRDNFARGGVSTFALTGSVGQLDIQTPAARAVDAATARSNGHYAKLAYSATRLQGVTDAVSLYGSINGQVASKNLDVSEKLELGGMYGVRAFPAGEAPADEGYVVSLEARLALPRLYERMASQVQLVAFYDIGRVTVNAKPWAPGNNSRTLSGAGVGLVWSATNNFLVRMYYARKLGSEVATSAPDRSGRFWIQAIKYF
jgi:hemolysin activation/secretion protein